MRLCRKPPPGETLIDIDVYYGVWVFSSEKKRAAEGSQSRKNKKQRGWKKPKKARPEFWVGSRPGNSKIPRTLLNTTYAGVVAVTLVDGAVHDAKT